MPSSKSRVQLIPLNNFVEIGAASKSRDVSRNIEPLNASPGYSDNEPRFRNTALQKMERGIKWL